MSVRDNDNRDARKGGGHHFRYNYLLRFIEQEGAASLRHDFTVGKLLHHDLMFTSGAFRAESFLRAANQAQYELLRFGRLGTFNGAVGTDIRTAVASALSMDIANPDAALPDLGEFIDFSKGINDSIRNNHLKIYEWFRENPDRLLAPIDEGELPVEITHENQRNSLTLAATHIAVAAALRSDDLSSVPFLEPKSISDVSNEPIYPLAA